MFYKIVMIVGGIALCVYGVKEFIVSRGTSSEAAEVKLADLEAGQAPPNNYVKLERAHSVLSRAGLLLSRPLGRREPRSFDEGFVRVLSDHLAGQSLHAGAGGARGQSQ